jgi:hypothetical protein
MSETAINNDITGLIQCTDCKNHKPKSDYDMNDKKKELYKTCKTCLAIRREKYDKRKDSIVKTEAEKNAKLAKNREYYAKNSTEIIENKKSYRANKINKVADPNSKYCKGCSTIKLTTDFGMNLKTKEPYKQCDSCRSK